MQDQILLLKEAPSPYDVPRKIISRPSPVAPFSDEVKSNEIGVPSEPGLKFRTKPLYETTSPILHYASEQGLYFAGHRPSCIIVGLGRSDSNRCNEVNITTVDHLLQIKEFIREQKQPYSLFVIDALPHDVLSGVDVIVQETARNKLYFNRKLLISVVEKGAEGLVSKLTERYSRSPLRFIEARKYGSDVIDANLFGQLRY